MSYNLADLGWSQRIAKEENRLFRGVQNRYQIEAIRDIDRLSSFTTYFGNGQKTNVPLSSTIKELEKTLQY